MLVKVSSELISLFKIMREKLEFRIKTSSKQLNFQ